MIKTTPANHPATSSEARGFPVPEGINPTAKNKMNTNKTITVNCDSQSHVTINGIRLPMLFRITCGYASGQSAHLLSVAAVGQGGWSKYGFWTTLPAVRVKVLLDQETEQTYTVARNENGIISPWLKGMDDQNPILVAV